MIFAGISRRGHRNNELNYYPGLDTSLNSLEISNITKSQNSPNSSSPNTSTINITHSNENSTSKPNHNKIQNSPDDDFEINEKELDENYNLTNQYNTPEVVSSSGQNNNYNSASTIANYYMKQSQYLSGITEQSIEESVFSQSQNNKINELVKK